jgi:hypothetical protein
LSGQSVAEAIEFEAFPFNNPSALTTKFTNNCNVLILLKLLFNNPSMEREMNQRDIGAEILTGLEEISAWKKGEIELKTTELKLPIARDVPNYLKTREALAICQGNFSEDIIQEREERL